MINRKEIQEYLKTNLTFLNEEETERLYNLITSGFSLQIALILIRIDENDRELKELVDSRKKEMENTFNKFDWKFNMYNISNFAKTKWEFGEDKNLSRYYSKKLDIINIRRKNGGNGSTK